MTSTWMRFRASWEWADLDLAPTWVGLDYIETFTPAMEQRTQLAGARVAGMQNQVHWVIRSQQREGGQHCAAGGHEVEELLSRFTDILTALEA